MRGKNLFFFVLGAGLVAAGLWGLSVGALTTFTAGTPIRASEVNNNFTVLRNAIVELEGRTGFGASLTGNAGGETGVGFKVRNEGVNGIALRGEVATTGWGVRGVAGGAGIGVQGEAEGAGGIGVQGKAAAGSIGVKGEVPTTGWGVRGVAGGAGIGVQGDAGANGIGVKGEAGTGGTGVLAKSDQGTALLVEGSIGVRGTRPAAFVHTTASGNITANFSRIDNPLTNGDPNAILIVTLLSVRGETPLTTPFGVWYDANRWTIFRADGLSMPQGVSFNVLVIKRP